jgi:hypothetical protein
MVISCLLLAPALVAQQPVAPVAPAPAPRIARIAITPATLTLNVNDTATLVATAYDSSGNRLVVPLTFISFSRRAVGVDSVGHVTAYRAGNQPVRLAALNLDAGFAMRAEANITVSWPPLSRIEIAGVPVRMFAGTTVRVSSRVIDAAGGERGDIPVTWTSDNPAVATVDQFGNVTAQRAGVAGVRASAGGGGVTGRQRVVVVANPARALVLTASADHGRTGDVLHFTAVARDASRRPIAAFPVTYSVTAEAFEDTVIAPEAPAQVAPDGRFVAQRAGQYTVVATAGNLVARKTVAITSRYTSIRLNSGLGEGRVSRLHTSDLWVWTGKDGHDYAVTGTWGSDGSVFFWDVSDPAHPALIDSIQVDARVVNDVKVDVERELCIVTREGASNRRNGFVVLDCHDPHHVQLLTKFDEGLTGGVHNTFVWDKYVFATNNGTRFDIISLEDPLHPRRLSFFELDTPGHGIHDIWVVDGIAYTSNWADGVVLIDVGNGKWGGSPSHPVKIGQYASPGIAAHSAYPYHSPTGKFYVFVGDERFPYDLDADGPDEAAGYVHVVDFTDLAHPQEVARYEVPEAGSHDFWIEHDTLYVAYYNAGLRVVDVSGELMGNLYQQGRELVRFEPRDAQGKVPNAPMTWGPQPFKGLVYVADHNSGLWSVKLPERQPAPLP